MAFDRVVPCFQRKKRRSKLLGSAGQRDLRGSVDDEREPTAEANSHGHGTNTGLSRSPIYRGLQEPCPEDGSAGVDSLLRTSHRAYK
jgi:hypothetical protein